MKRTIIIIILLVLLVSLVGCMKNDLEDFKAAVKKTDNIPKGKLTTSSKLEMDFDTKGLSDKDLRGINYFKMIKSNSDITFDNELDMIISQNYFNLGGLGFDTAIYKDKERLFIKIPILEKYMILNDMLSERKDNEKEEGHGYVLISKETKKTLEDKWLSILKEENIVSGRKNIISTPNGEVKARHYTIELTNEQIKDLVDGVTNLIAKDKVLQNNINNFINENTGEGDTIEKVSVENILEKFKEIINRGEIENFEYNAYIDKKGYIIKENMLVKIKFNKATSNRLKSISYEFEDQRWEINEEQKFRFPELTKANVIDIDNINKGALYILEDIFSKK